MRHVPSRRHEDPGAGLGFFEESLFLFIDEATRPHNDARPHMDQAWARRLSITQAQAPTSDRLESCRRVPGYRSGRWGSAAC